MILISGIAHKAPALINDQIILYNLAMGGEQNCHHVLHINADSVRSGLLQDLQLPNNVTVNPNHLYTRRPTFLGCHVSNILHATRSGLNFSHVYMHTDSDIPYRHGLGAHILSYDIGMNVPSVFNPDNSMGIWARPVGKDFRLSSFIEEIGDGNIYTCRYEGMFATRLLMSEIFAQMMAVWPFDENYWRADYPYEEFALPTITVNLLRNRTLKRTRNAVVTGPSHARYNLRSRECLNVANIPVLNAEPEGVFAAKFAPPELDSAVRIFARRSLGLMQ